MAQPESAAEERQSRIGLRASLRDLERGGTLGAEPDDWLAAEPQVDSRRE